MTQIPLRGCAPEPLIHYLKALGILRLVAEQLDPQARAAWHGDTFMLETTKSEDEVLNFFLNHYRPTPIVAPWNGGSGFYEGDDTTGIDGILANSTQRLDSYRRTIETILSWSEISRFRALPIQEMRRQVLGVAWKSQGKARKDILALTREFKRSLIDLFGKDKQQIRELSQLTIDAFEDQLEQIPSPNSQDEKQRKETKRKLLKSGNKLRTKVKQLGRSSGKEELFRICRSRLDDEVVSWLDAAYVLGEEKPDFPPLLGSGGNDGRFDFTTNYMARLLSVLSGNTELRLRGALFARPVSLEKAAVGQFYPGGAGGANATQGVDGAPYVNPWDFVLALEGSLMLASATVRQLAAGARSKASFPFTVRNSNIGYGTATDNEKVRAEIWLPLWSRFTSYVEIAYIFKEGRVQFSNRRTVRTGFDFARAVAELGVDRGIDAFQRYAFIERNGQANLATPLGIFEVRERPLAARIYELDRNRWLDFFFRATSDDKTPPRFVRARKRIEEAIFKLCATGNVEHLRETLIALGAAEAELSDGERFRGDKNLSPLTGLSLRWVSECNDGSDEFRIASALAAMRGVGKVGSFRSNVESFDDASRSWAQRSTSAVWSNAGLEENLASVLQRRSIDARSQSLSHPPISSSRFASLASVDAFLSRETDDEELEDLLHGLILIDWSQDKTPESKIEKRNIPPTLPRAYALLKLLFLPEGKFQSKPDAETIVIKHEPSIIPLLRAGRVPDALETAERRLRASGVMPLTTDFYLRGEDGARLAAALLIPIDDPSIREIARLVLRDEAED